MSVVSLNRRHSTSRSVQRRWDDWCSEWPLQFIILPVLVAFAFCLVLFLGSKHGTRLAAVRTWFPTMTACKSVQCAKGVAVDSEGGIVAGLGGVGTSEQTTQGGAALHGALSGITGLLGLESSQGAAAAPPVAQPDLGLLPLAPEDEAKFDFAHWISEAEKLVGVQARDCETGYGLSYIEQWRKAHVDWCSPDGGTPSPTTAAATAAAATSAAAVAAAAEAAVETKAAALALRGRLLRSEAKAAAAQTAKTGSGGGSGVAAAGDKSAAASGEAAEDPAVRSSITLYPFKDKDAYLMFAASRNTVVDSKTFLGSLPGSLPEAKAGSYRAACLVDNRTTPKPDFMKLNTTRRWVDSALQAEEYDGVPQACSVSSIDASQPRTEGPVLHPVLLLSRSDPTNAFRTVEEVVTAFTNLAVLNDPELTQKGLQVVIADGKPPGFYLDLWAAVSRPYPLRLLAQSPWPPNTCLTQAIHNGYSGASILTSLGKTKRTNCKSAVVIAAALWLRHVLAPAIQPPALSAFSTIQSKGITRKSVVWISRRNFEGLAHANLTPWQDQRRFSNEGEVVLELQREIWRWNDEACLRNGLPKSFGSGRRRQRHLMAATLRGAALEADRYTGGGSDDVGVGRGGHDGAVVAGGGAEVPGSRRRLQAASKCRNSNVFYDLRVIELNDLPFFPDNLQVLGNAAILVGAHGTGLANMIWMPPAKSGVLELQHNSAGNDLYQNMAHMLGHKCVNVESDGDRVELPAAAEGLRKLLDMLGNS